jgi:sugar/nucleoside kinase (ribokinase family)
VPLNCRKELVEFLKNELSEFKVVVMPDFFFDRLISLDWNVDILSKNLETVTRNKGGSIDDVLQTDLRGGNAINTASAMAALGVKVIPIVCTNKLGLQMIKFHLKPHSVDLSHIKIFGEASMTTAIELETENGKVNVMLRNVGSLAEFGPQHLDSDDFEAIEKADYVCVFNWAGTKRFGTKLARTVFHHAKTRGTGKTYCDTADPTPNKDEIPELIKHVLRGKDVDVLSVNENEAICYATQLSGKTKVLKRRLPLEEAAKESARILASHLSARIDLHTTSFSATFTKKSETVVPTFEVPVLRATGAGDAWNAGNILGNASGLSDDCRLTLANAVAAYYVSDKNGKHPTRQQLGKFCRKFAKWHQ